MDVLHQVFGCIESLLTLVNLLRMKIDLRLHSQRILVHELLFLTRRTSCIPVLIVRMLLDVLNFGVHAHFTIDVFGSCAILFLPCVEVCLDRLRLLVSLSFFFVGN